MRICTRCKRELPETSFYWDKFAGRFKSDCKDCNSIMKRHAYKQKKRNKRKEAAQKRYEMAYILGGIRVFIPYHTKEGEFKYNILQTGHKIKRTNDKAVFLRLIKQSLSKMDSLSLKYDSPTLGSKNGE